MNFSKAQYLSYLIEENSPRYGDKGDIEIKRTSIISNGDTSNNSELSFSAHLGTHIDAPYHFSENGEILENYSADFWVFNKPYLIHYEAASDQIINVDHLNEHLLKMPKNIDILIIKTNFSNFRKLDREKYIFHNPGLAPDLGFWLRENSSVKIVGFDFISLSSYQNRILGRQAHKAFLDDFYVKNKAAEPILLIEDMDLSNLKSCPNNIIVSPLRFKKSDGAPATIFAFYD